MRTITLCGSGKKRDEISEAARLLQERGAIVFAPSVHKIEELLDGQPDETWEFAWKGVTFAHLNRIEKADVVFIVNPGGYLGPSTTLELGYAVALRKLIVAMRPDNTETARTVLLDVVLDTDDVAEACRKLAGHLGLRER
jgi:nucleoside 2-deoxyribosyltransferase